MMKFIKNITHKNCLFTYQKKSRA